MAEDTCKISFTYKGKSRVKLLVNPNLTKSYKRAHENVTLSSTAKKPADDSIRHFSEKLFIINWLTNY